MILWTHLRNMRPLWFITRLPVNVTIYAAKTRQNRETGSIYPSDKLVYPQQCEPSCCKCLLMFEGITTPTEHEMYCVLYVHFSVPNAPSVHTKQKPFNINPLVDLRVAQRRRTNHNLFNSTGKFHLQRKCTIAVKKIICEVQLVC